MNVEKLYLILLLLINPIVINAQFLDSKIIISTGEHSPQYYEIDSNGIRPLYLNDDPSGANFMFNDDSLVYGLFDQGGRHGKGEFFSFNPESGNYTELFSVGPATGIEKKENISGIEIDDQGILWATVHKEEYDGSLMRIDSAINFSRVFNFDSYTTGTAPNSNLIYNDGFVYGITGNGGNLPSPGCSAGSDWGMGCLYRYKINSGDLEVLKCFSGCLPYWEYYGYKLILENNKIVILRTIKYNLLYAPSVLSTYVFDIGLDSLLELPTRLKSAVVKSDKIYGIGCKNDTCLMSIDMSSNFSIDTNYLSESHDDIFIHEEYLILSNQNKIRRIDLSQELDEIVFQAPSNERITSITKHGKYLVYNMQSCSTESIWSCYNETLWTFNLMNGRSTKYFDSEIYSYRQDGSIKYQDFSLLGLANLSNNLLTHYVINSINGEKTDLFTFEDSIYRNEQQVFVREGDVVWFYSYQGGDHKMGGVIKADLSQNTFQYVYSFDSVFRYQNGTTSLVKGEGKIFIGRGQKLLSFDTQSEKVSEMPLYDTLNSINAIIDNLHFFDNKLYWYYNSSLYRYDLISGAFNQRKIPNDLGIETNVRVYYSSNYVQYSQRFWVGMWYMNSANQDSYGLLSFKSSLEDIQFYKLSPSVGKRSVSNILINGNSIIGSVYRNNTNYNYVRPRLYSFDLDSLQYFVFFEVPKEITGMPLNDIMLIPYSDVEKSESKNLSIYPNPSNNFIKIVGNNNSKISRYEIFDLNGSKIYQKSNPPISVPIDISKLIRGMYILRVIFDNGVVSKKFVKTF